MRPADRGWIAPGLIDRYPAEAGDRGQLTPQDLPPDAPANLDQPVPGRYGAHGRFDGRRPRTGSWQMFTDRHEMAVYAKLALLGVAALGGAAKQLDI